MLDRFLILHSCLCCTCTGVLDGFVNLIYLQFHFDESWNEMHDLLIIERAKLLKACGTLPETLLEFRKSSGNRADTSVELEESLDFNSW
ncbi:hypothetical protein OROMI_012846 [Orobanche minor]